jgi:hypothetical protein
VTPCDDPWCSMCARLADGRRASSGVHLSPAEEAFFSRELGYVRPALFEVSYPAIKSLTYLPMPKDQE